MRRVRRWWNGGGPYGRMMVILMGVLPVVMDGLSVW